MHSVSTFLDIGLKEEYRSDEDDLVKDFFIPCFSKCVEYDRCIEYLSIDMLKTVFDVYDNFRRGAAKMRLIAGHRFRPTDLDLLTVLLSKSRNPFEKRNIKDEKLRLVRRAFERGQIELKIGISNDIKVSDTFSEKLGIYRDKHGHVIAYVSTAKSSFDVKKKAFESIEVFTSWGDATRVKRKMQIFERLWRNRVKYIDMHGFEYAAKNGYLKYWKEWVMHD